MKNLVLMSGNVRGSEDVANCDLSQLHELFALVGGINTHNSFEVYGQFASPWLNQRVPQISGQPRRVTLLSIISKRPSHEHQRQRRLRPTLSVSNPFHSTRNQNYGELNDRYQTSQ
jgi:hypothetical protein